MNFQRSRFAKSLLTQRVITSRSDGAERVFTTVDVTGTKLRTSISGFGRRWSSLRHGTDINEDSYLQPLEHTQ
jgi:hypothetical protein